MGEKAGAHQAERPGGVSAGLSLLCVLGLSTTLVVLALRTAGGVTYLGGDSYRTEFANPKWWAAGFLLFVPVYLVARRHPALAFISVIAALGPQVVLPVVVVHRYVVTGWADGLESLGYLYPILMSPVFSAAAVAGAVVGKRKQRAHDV